MLNIYHKDVSFNELFGVKSSFIDKQGIKINPGEWFAIEVSDYLQIIGKAVEEFISLEYQIIERKL